MAQVDRIPDEVTHHRTKVTDIAHKISKLRWQCAGHIRGKTDEVSLGQLDHVKANVVWNAMECEGKRPIYLKKMAGRMADEC